MQPSDLRRFGELLADVMAYYRRDVSEFVQDLFWNACRNFEFEQVASAFEAHAKDPENGRFPPMVADLVRVLQGTKTDRSLVAWGKVMDAMQRVGGYQSVAFDDPTIHAVIADMGGWGQLCSGELKELPFQQRRFCDAHKAYSQRPGTPYPPVLVGRFEAENRVAGQPVAAPILVGNPTLAQAVIAGGSDQGRSQMLSLDAVPLLQRPVLKRLGAANDSNGGKEAS